MKNLLLFNRSLNTLTQFDNSSEMEDIINSQQHSQKLIKSFYTNFLQNTNIFSLMQKYNLFEENEISLNENIKITSELRSFEEKILFYSMMNQKNELIIFIKKYLALLLKYNLYYRVLDFFMFYFQVNEKRIFSILENKRDEILKELRDEQFSSGEIPEDLRNYLNNMI